MRVAVRVVRRQADEVEKGADLRLDLAGGCKAEALDRPPDQLAHGLARIERGVRILEHDLRGSAHRNERALRLAGHGLASDADRAAIGLHQAQDRAPKRRFSRAGLANKPDHLAGRDLIDTSSTARRRAGR